MVGLRIEQYWLEHRAARFVGGGGGGAFGSIFSGYVSLVSNLKVHVLVEHFGSCIAKGYKMNRISAYSNGFQTISLNAVNKISFQLDIFFFE